MFVFLGPWPFAWAPVLALAPSPGSQFVFTGPGPGPQFVFASPGPQFVFNGPDPEFVSTSPGPQLVFTDPEETLLLSALVPKFYLPTLTPTIAPNLYLPVQGKILLLLPQLLALQSCAKYVRNLLGFTDNHDLK